MIGIMRIILSPKSALWWVAISGGKEVYVCTVVEVENTSGEEILGFVRSDSLIDTTKSAFSAFGSCIDEIELLGVV